MLSGTAWSMLRDLVVQIPIILHDNARSHKRCFIDLLRRWQWEILKHPEYSTNMSPCTYDLFAKGKESLGGTRYNTRDEIPAIRLSIIETQCLLSVIWWFTYAGNSINEFICGNPLSTKMKALMVYDDFQTFVKGDYFWSLKQSDSSKNIFFVVNSNVATNYWMPQV